MDHRNLPTLESTRIVLRRVRDDDVDAVYSIFSDPQVMRYWSTPPLSDKQAAINLINEIRDANERGAMLKWGMALRAVDTVIGTVTLFNLDLRNGRGELGYALGRAFWGQGLMHEALQALLTHAFERLDFRRLEADVDPRNIASIKTLERLGFRREGFLRERWHVAGEVQDTYFYGLLRREWVRPRIS